MMAVCMMAGAVAFLPVTSWAEDAASLSTCFKTEPMTIYTTQKGLEVHLMRAVDRGNGALDFMDHDPSGKTAVAVRGLIHPNKQRWIYEVRDLSGLQIRSFIEHQLADDDRQGEETVTTETYSEPWPVYPTQVRTGGRFMVQGQGVLVVNEEDPKPIHYQDRHVGDYTFVGFEDLKLTLQGKKKTFSNTCHFKAKGPERLYDYWFAPGLDVIKTEIRDSTGKLVFEDKIATLPRKDSLANSKR